MLLARFSRGRKVAVISAVSVGVAGLLLDAVFGAGRPLQVLRGHVPSVTARLESVGALPSSTQLHLVLGLPLRNRDTLERLLKDIYDPASPSYRHFLTSEQFTERFGPTTEDYNQVAAFARKSGFVVTGRHSNRTLLDVTASVADIERAFHIRLLQYPHPKEKRLFFAPDTEPSLDLAVRLLSIRGLDNFILPRPAFHLSTAAQSTNKWLAGSGPSGNYQGYDFRNAYAPGVTLTGAGQTVALFECDGYYPTDIVAYASQAGVPNIPLTNVLIDGFNGSVSNVNDEVEVALDIEMAMCMAPGLSSIVVYEGPGDTAAVDVDILNRIATDGLANQISSSWVIGDSTQLAQIYTQFAAQGQSFFQASGDEGAYFPGIFQFEDSPLVTLVGGTTLTTTGPDGSWVSETAWNGSGAASGGGYTTNYPIPSWQQGISMVSNQGSTTYRNVPDVALTADNVYVVADQGLALTGVGGTSVAAPLWAGFTALVNQQGMANGRSPVGFLNPTIYGLAQGANYSSLFHDITTGNNLNGAYTNKYFAVAGYDLCTGWGTPTGSNLINTLAPLDALQIAPGSGFTTYGLPGGPFTQSTWQFSLTNIGASPLNWTLATTSPWLTASPGGGALIQGGTPATVIVDLTPSADSLATGVYSAVVWFTNLNDGAGLSRAFTLQVLEPPVITNEPASQNVLEAAVAIFTVGAASAAPLTYAWQTNGVSLVDGGRISGSATSTLTISNVSPADVTSYQVLVSNPVGGASSSPAQLAIVPSVPVILTQPTNQAAVVGASVSFAVYAAGTHPLSFQWSYDATNLDGATNAVLTLTDVQLAQAGDYAVTVSNSLGSILSSNAVLAVDDVPPVITQEPVSQRVVVGGSAAFTISATGTAPLNYQWIFNGNPMSGQTGLSLTLPIVQMSNSGSYVVQVTNLGGAAISFPAAVLTVVPGPFAGSTYSITDLGTLGGFRSEALAINDNGQIAGLCEFTNSSGPIIEHAFLYSGGVMTDLGTLGGTISVGLALNNSHQVVGYSTTSAGRIHGFICSNGVMTDLGTLGGTTSRAMAINDGGQIVGSANNTSNQSRAWLYPATDLGTFGGPAGAALGINDEGQIVGWAAVNPLTNHAFLYSGGKMTDLAAFGGLGNLTANQANAINNNGQVVGFAGNLAGTISHAFVLSNGRMADLGALSSPYTNSQAIAINGAGQIVGRLFGNSSQHAFIWTGGIMTDLNNLVDPATGWTLEEATGINDAGQIAGYGTIASGQTHGFLLTPCNVLSVYTFGNNLIISWPTNATGFSLFSTTNLATTNWAAVTIPVILTNGQNQVSVSPASAAGAFYRLQAE